MNNFNMNMCQSSCHHYEKESSHDELCEQDLFSPEEAFMLGNAFKNLYTPYRCMPPFIYRPTTAREHALLQVSILEFYVHELNLYLNTHPCDRKALELFTKYNNLAMEARMQFENNHSPLLISNMLCHDSWDWVKEPWPWQNERTCH